MVLNQAIHNLPCTKCHCQWPSSAIYCICGTKLQKRSLGDFMAMEFKDLIAVFTLKKGGKNEKQ